MSKCQRCASERICSIYAKSSDLNSGDIAGVEFDGYVPHDVGIGGGDSVEIDWCLQCGHIQGEWPIETPAQYVKEPEEAFDFDDFFKKEE